MSVDRLSAEDRVMLEADALWPQDVGALLFLDGGSLLDATGTVEVDRIRQAIASRLHLVPRLRQVIHVPRRGLGGPLWVDTPDFDLGNHIRVAQLPVGADETLVRSTVEMLRREPLRRSVPLWEMWILPGMAECRMGVFLRFHHAIADGRAAMMMLAAFLELTADARAEPARPWVPARPPSSRRLLATALAGRAQGAFRALRRIAQPRSVVSGIRTTIAQSRELLGEGPASDTSLNRLVGPSRTFVLLRENLAEVRQIGHNHGATPNDVLISMTAAGLRAVLKARGEPVQELKVRAYAPVSLRRSMRASEGNLISQMVVHLPVDKADPGARLEQIATETARRKATPRSSMGTWFRLQFIRRLLLKAFARQRVNTVITTVHGPRRTAYLAGARVLELFPLLNLFGNQTLGVGALTYGDGFYVGLTVDRDAYPDVHVLASAMRDELDALRALGNSGAIRPTAA